MSSSRSRSLERDSQRLLVFVSSDRYPPLTFTSAASTDRSDSKRDENCLLTLTRVVKDWSCGLWWTFLRGGGVFPPSLGYSCVTYFRRVILSLGIRSSTNPMYLFLVVLCLFARQRIHITSRFQSSILGSHNVVLTRRVEKCRLSFSPSSPLFRLFSS